MYLASFLEEQHTCSALAYILLDTLYYEVHGQHPAFQHQHGGTNPRFQALIQAQTNIGWSQIFQGRLVNNWATLQEDFLLRPTLSPSNSTDDTRPAPSGRGSSSIFSG